MPLAIPLICPHTTCYDLTYPVGSDLTDTQHTHTTQSKV